MSKFLIDPSGRMDYDPIVMKQTLDQMYRVEQPVSQFSNLLTGLGQGTVSNINQLAYLSRAMFGDGEISTGINEWANKKLSAIEPTSYDSTNASVLDYIPFVSNMYSSGEAARQVGNLVGQLAPDIALTLGTAGVGSIASAASLTTRAAAVGIAKKELVKQLKKEGYQKALETIARAEVTQGITPGLVSSAVTGARAGFEGMSTIGKAMVGSLPMDTFQAGKSAGGVYGEMTEKGYSREDAQTGALESFGGNLALNTVANTAHIMGAMAAFGKNTVKATEGATNVAKQSTDNVIAGMEKNPILQTFKRATESTPAKIASIPAMMAFGGYEESIADDIDRAAMTGEAFNPTLNPLKFDAQQVQSFAGGALLGGTARTTGVVGGALRDRAEQRKAAQELARENARQAQEAAQVIAAQQQAQRAAQQAANATATTTPAVSTNQAQQPNIVQQAAAPQNIAAATATTAAQPNAAQQPVVNEGIRKDFIDRASAISRSTKYNEYVNRQLPTLDNLVQQIDSIHSSGGTLTQRDINNMVDKATQGISPKIVVTIKNTLNDYYDSVNTNKHGSPFGSFKAVRNNNPNSDYFGQYTLQESVVDNVGNIVNKVYKEKNSDRRFATREEAESFARQISDNKYGKESSMSVITHNFGDDNVTIESSQTADVTGRKMKLDNGTEIFITDAGYMDGNNEKVYRYEAYDAKTGNALYYHDGNEGTTQISAESPDSLVKKTKDAMRSQQNGESFDKYNYAIHHANDEVAQEESRRPNGKEEVKTVQLKPIKEMTKEELNNHVLKLERLNKELADNFKTAKDDETRSNIAKSQSRNRLSIRKAKRIMAEISNDPNAIINFNKDDIEYSTKQIELAKGKLANETDQTKINEYNRLIAIHEKNLERANKENEDIAAARNQENNTKEDQKQESTKSDSNEKVETKEEQKTELGKIDTAKIMDEYKSIQEEQKRISSLPEGKQKDTATDALGKRLDAFTQMAQTLKKQQDEINNKLDEQDQKTIEVYTARIKDVDEGFVYVPNDATAEMLKNKAPHLELFRKGGRWAARIKEGGSVTLNSGFDPIAAYNALKPLAKEITKAMPILVDYGKKLYNKGHSTSKQWIGQMQSMLKDLWNNFKGKMGEIWKQVKASVNNERGSIGYKNAPNSLMGFSKDQARQKGFSDTNYKHEQWVEVTFEDGTKHIDAIMGLNKAHAIERARRNWNGAEIQALTKEEAFKKDKTLFSKEVNTNANGKRMEGINKKEEPKHSNNRGRSEGKTGQISRQTNGNDPRGTGQRTRIDSGKAVSDVGLQLLRGNVPTVSELNFKLVAENIIKYAGDNKDLAKRIFEYIGKKNLPILEMDDARRSRYKDAAAVYEYGEIYYKPEHLANRDDLITHEVVHAIVTDMIKSDGSTKSKITNLVLQLLDSNRVIGKKALLADNLKKYKPLFVRKDYGSSDPTKETIFPDKETDYFKALDRAFANTSWNSTERSHAAIGILHMAESNLSQIELANILYGTNNRDATNGQVNEVIAHLLAAGDLKGTSDIFNKLLDMSHETDRKVEQWRKVSNSKNGQSKLVNAFIKGDINESTLASASKVLYSREFIDATNEERPYSLTEKLSKAISVLPKDLQDAIGKLNGQIKLKGITIDPLRPNKDMKIWDKLVNSNDLLAKKYKEFAPHVAWAYAAEHLQHKLQKAFVKTLDRMYIEFTSPENKETFLKLRRMFNLDGREPVQTVRISDDKWAVVDWHEGFETFKKEDEAQAKLAEFKNDFKYAELLHNEDNGRYTVIGFDTDIVTDKAAAESLRESMYYDTMESLGANKEVADTYKKMREFYDNTHKIVSATAEACGLPPLKYMYAYAPHHFDNFIIYRKETVVDENGNPVIYKKGKKKGQQKYKYVGIDSFPTLKDAVHEAGRIQKESGNTLDLHIRDKKAEFMSGGTTHNTELQDNEEAGLMALKDMLGEKDVNELHGEGIVRFPTIEKALNEAINEQGMKLSSDILKYIESKANKKERYNSRIATLLNKNETVTYKQAMTFLRHNGAKHRFYENSLSSQGKTGYSQNMERMDYKYAYGAARYISHEPLRHNGSLLYEKQFGKKITETPVTVTQKKIQEFHTEMNGMPDKLDDAINQVLYDLPYVGRFIKYHIGDNPIQAIASNAKMFNTIVKMGLLRPSAALVNVSHFININAKLDGDSEGVNLGKFVGFGTNTRAAAGRAKDVFLAERGLGKITDKVKEDIALLNEMEIGNEIKWYQDYGFNHLQEKSVKELFGNIVTDKDWAMKGKNFAELMNRSLVLFNAADTYLRQTAALGAYDKAIKKGMTHEDAMKYAKDLVNLTMFSNSKVSKSDLLKMGGSVGSMMMQFQTYPFRMMEFMFHGLEGKKEWVPFATSFVLMTGLAGIPFMTMINNASQLAFGTDTDEKMKKILFAWAGKDEAKQFLARSALYGVWGNTLGIDIGKRVGMGDFPPSKISDFAGPTFGGIYSVLKMAHDDAAWDMNKATDIMKTIAPPIGDWTSAIRGQSISTTDHYSVKKEYTPGERIMRLLGFTPLAEAVERDKANVISKEERARKSKSTAVVEAYIKNPSADNRAKLRELGVSNEQLKNAIKNRGKTPSEKIVESVPNKYKQQYANISGFN